MIYLFQNFISINHIINHLLRYRPYQHTRRWLTKRRSKINHPERVLFQTHRRFLHQCYAAGISHDSTEVSPLLSFEMVFVCWVVFVDLSRHNYVWVVYINGK